MKSIGAARFKEQCLALLNELDAEGLESGDFERAACPLHYITAACLAGQCPGGVDTINVMGQFYSRCAQSQPRRRAGVLLPLAAQNP